MYIILWVDRLSVDNKIIIIIINHEKLRLTLLKSAQYTFV